MHKKDLNEFFLTIEYRAERNISLVRSVFLLAVTGLFIYLSLKSEEWDHMLLPLVVSASIAIVLFADVVLLYRHPRAANSIKIAKFLGAPLDVFVLSLLIYYLYETKLFYISPGWGLAMLLLAAGAFTSIFSIFRVSAACVLLNFLSTAGAYAYVSYFLERNKFFLINLLRFRQIVAYEIAFYFFLLLIGVFSFLAARSMRKRMIRLLTEQKYRSFLPPGMVKEIVGGRKQVTDNQERQQLTILSADIRLFAAIAEKNKPENVKKFFNHFLGEMVELVYMHEGMLDTVTDAGFRAVFGAPFPDVRAAENAVRAAFAIQKATAELRLGIPIHLGIGIHSDETICGYVGPPHHRNFTILGEAINTVNGIVELTKQTKQSIIISETTREQLPQGIDAQKLGNAKIKGSKEGIAVYIPIIQ